MKSTGKIIEPIRRSAMHRRVLELIKRLYPNFRVENETRVHTPAGNLPVDILIRELQIAIECQGVQHFQYTAHFHRVPEDFTAQKQRDTDKRSSIIRAGWSYLAIRYDQYEKLTTTKLAKLITKAIKEKL